jgi:hypothetical protein
LLCKFGTLQIKNDFEPSPPAITEALKPSSLYTMLQIPKLSIVFHIGLMKFERYILDIYGSKDAPKLIVANKCDLADKTLVSSTEGKSFAEEMEFGFIETSAKTGMNVDGAFTTIVTEVIKRQQRLNALNTYLSFN